MAEKITTLCEILSFFLQGYCLQFFLGSFLKERFRGRCRNGLIVLFCYGVFKTALSFCISFEERTVSGFYKLILHSLLLVILTFVFYRAFQTITIFLLVTFLALNEISFFLGYLVMAVSSHVLEMESGLFAKGYIGMETFELLLQGTAAALQILCCSLWVLLLYLSLKRVAGSFREKDHGLHRTELLFILTPGLVGLLLCVLLRIIMITVEDGMPALVYDRYPSLRLLVPAIFLLSLMSIVHGVRLFQDMILLSRERNSRIILEQQIDTLQEHIRETERLYEGVRSVKHDMKNTLSVLMRLFAEKGSVDDPELTAYLAEMNQSFDRLELRFRTGNTVADALLNMKYHEMIRLIPDLNFQADGLLFLEHMPIQSYDIGVILGNALDNAMEGCMRLKEEYPAAKPLIRLSSLQRGRYFFLEIANSFDGKLSLNGGSEFPATRKKDRHLHGIGLENMKKTAEKYGGTVDYSIEGNPDANNSRSGYAIFTLSVMMKV